FRGQADSRRGEHHPGATRAGLHTSAGFTGTVAALECQHVRAEAGGVLLRQRVVVLRQATVVERALDLFDPGVAEVVEDTRLDAGPVVNRHGHPLCAARGQVSFAHYTGEACTRRPVGYVTPACSGRRQDRYASSCSSASGSTGLTRWWSKPHSCARRRSSSWP